MECLFQLNRHGERMPKESSYSPALQVVRHLLLAGFGFVGGWLVWQMAVPGFELIGLFAALFVLGGLIRLIQAFGCMVQMIWKLVRVSRFETRGTKPKADKLARISDLKRRGLIK